jgi:hypothetical protein
MKKRIFLVLIVLVIYGLSFFDDTEEFQQTIIAFVRLIQSAQGFALPPLWLENRMFAWGVTVVVLLWHYRSVWASYRSLFSAYKSRTSIAQKPALSLQQANYLYLQNRVPSLVVWLIQLCEAGVLTLHYKKGINPWSISRNSTEQPSPEFDRQLLNDLFLSKDKLVIKASISDPNPLFRKLSDHLYSNIESDNGFLAKERCTSLTAWLVLACMLIEVPFVSAFYTDIPALIVIVLCFVVATAVVVYTIMSQLQGFFSGHAMETLFALFIPLLVLAILHWGFLGMGSTQYYFFIPFYPEVVVAIAVLVRFAPVFPKDQFLLSHILAYRNHLQHSKTAITEADIPWTIGLQVNSGLFAQHWNYQASRLPPWIDTEEEDVQKVMRDLHMSFGSSVSSAVYGKHKAKLRSRRASQRF